jgi:hypothetical protein
MNIHLILIGVALGLAILSIIKPSWPCLAVAVILIAADLKCEGWKGGGRSKGKLRVRAKSP